MCAEANRIPPASASSSDAAEKVQLVITTADAAAEIFVVDGDLRLCARGIGKLDTRLTPGIYKVKIRTGLSTQEEYMVLRDAPVQKQFAPLSFSTPVPLTDTAKTHEYHELAAFEQSGKTHVKAGQGSSIFVFARDWTSGSPAGPASPRPSFNPAGGLKLKSLDGNVIADLEQSSATSLQLDPDKSHDPWAACAIEANPGAYLLSVETPEGQLAQTVIAPPNWHTHIFLLQHSYGPDQMKRADLAGGSIMLSQTRQFTPNQDEARLVELARLGLTEQRKVLSSDLRQMLSLKFTDPMLGIFAGHLMLNDPSPDLQLLSTVVENLRSLLQYPHPDVDALALKLRTGPVLEVRIPPMLRRSWSIILDASVDQRAMVMRDSPAAGVIGRVCSVDPWLICLRAAPTEAETDEVRRSVFKDVLDDHLARVQRGESEADSQSSVVTRGLQRAPFQGLLRAADKKPTESVEFEAAPGEGEGFMRGGPAEGVEFEAAPGEGEASEGAPTESVESEPVPGEEFNLWGEMKNAPVASKSKSITEAQVKELIHTLGVPRFYLEDLLKESGITLSEK
jgi:hypothetical protein